MQLSAHHYGVNRSWLVKSWYAKSHVCKCFIQVGCVTRLVPQKGVHLIRHSIYRTLERGGQYVLLGSSPVPQIQVCFSMNNSRTNKFLDPCSACLFASAATRLISLFINSMGCIRTARVWGYSPSVRKPPPNSPSSQVRRGTFTCHICGLGHLCDSIYIWALRSHTGRHFYPLFPLQSYSMDELYASSLVRFVFSCHST